MVYSPILMVKFVILTGLVIQQALEKDKQPCQFFKWYEFQISFWQLSCKVSVSLTKQNTSIVWKKYKSSKYQWYIFGLFNVSIGWYTVFYLQSINVSRDINFHLLVLFTAFPTQKLLQFGKKYDITGLLKK